MKSLKVNLAWNFAGLTVYNFSQWLLLLILARLADPRAVGQFSFILALSAPIFLAAGLNLRLYMATDVSYRWRLTEYRRLRTIANAVAVMSVIVAGFAVRLHWLDMVALVVLAAAKVVEASSQLEYARYQRAERFDLVARSLVARSAFGPVLFLLLFAVTDQLWGACLGLFLGWLMAQLVFDRSATEFVCKLEPEEFHLPIRPGSVRSLFVEALPLGFDQGVSSLTVNAPRYSVQYTVGSSGLAVYSSLSYLAQIVSMVGTSMAGVFNPRLARYYRSGNQKGFIRLIVFLLCFAGTIGFLATLGAYLFGDFFVRNTLGPEYVNRELLVSLMVAAALITLQRALSKVLESSHKFGRYLALDITIAAVVCALSPFLVHRYGLVGAAYATVCAYAIGITICGYLAIRVIRSLSS
ncbi:lipopolysaccharide biosynthesis protein [Dietzia natronolimnaea]|uniref:lipopolysaccharide biosynthesis protein n=1 Tax=Dietzia natronolimnaea TaxID=161920 RepID=UPI001140B34A|nr:polysaccharide biosynthesis C-terminal domain-containing protein [Dietzia natronolimnaea]